MAFFNDYGSAKVIKAEDVAQGCGDSGSRPSDRQGTAVRPSGARAVWKKQRARRRRGLFASVAALGEWGQQQACLRQSRLYHALLFWLFTAITLYGLNEWNVNPYVMAH